MSIEKSCNTPGFSVSWKKSSEQKKAVIPLKMFCSKNKSAVIHHHATSNNYAGIFVTNGFTEISHSEIEHSV